jgi:hypothetical protein
LATPERPLYGQDAPRFPVIEVRGVEAERDVGKALDRRSVRDELAFKTKNTSKRGQMTIFEAETT